MNARIDGVADASASIAVKSIVNGGEAVSRQWITGFVNRLEEAEGLSLADIVGDSASNDLVQALFECALGGVVVAEERGVIVHYNASAAAIFGYPAAEVLGMTLPKLLPKTILDEWIERDDNAPMIAEVQAIRRSGTSLPLNVKFNRLRVTGRDLTVIYVRDMSELHLRQKEISRLAHIDQLTGLPNRNLFQDRMTQTLAQARRYRRVFAVLYIDLDRFKQINDCHGHNTGDRVLREIGRRLKTCVRETDTVARIGGDEFAALLTDLRQEDDVRIVASRILNMCSRPVEVGTGSFELGASVGISLFPSDGDDLESLMRRADSAMYHAKMDGRGRFAFYTAELNAVAERKAMIERGLRRALQEGGLLLHFQPQVDLNTGALLGAEALLRWQDRGTLMQPGEFIPVAEESGLIVPMGEWVLREACREAQRWNLMGLGAGAGIRVGVNLSVKQFTDRLPELVFDVLRETGLPSHLLDLEITESFLASDRNATDILQRLEEGGVHLSVDDFGTGYSCLAYLKDLPLHTIKIDRSFVRDLRGAHDSNAAVVETIVTLANKLGRTTLAEGVETEEQAEALRQLGCTVCQGFLYARPLPGEEFVRFAGEKG